MLEFCNQHSKAILYGAPNLTSLKVNVNLFVLKFLVELDEHRSQMMDRNDLLLLLAVPILVSISHIPHCVKAKVF